jgi:N-acetylglucosaminyldiphosphoundecaprenol N-acetyl-beta-D-mannosaminyltransferase
MTPSRNITRTAGADRAQLAGLEFSRLSEAAVVMHIIEQLTIGEGGWVVPANVDVCRQTQRDPAVRALVEQADLIVPDGMPLVWGARLKGQPVAERVAGSALIFSLTSAAAEAGRSIYLLGGAPGIPEAAGQELTRLYPDLKIAGTDSPPLGFEKSAAAMAQVRDRLLHAAPDIVYVGLGFPKQERLIAELASTFAATWFISCGAAIPFAAGTLSRAPVWMQKSGLEWFYRLLSEPRRLFRRYLVDDLPYAANLLASCVIDRINNR